MVYMMYLDDGGTFLTRHYALVVWLPHELIDVATECIRYSRVGEIGNTGDRAIAQHNGTKDALTESREQSEMEAAFAKHWIPKLQVQVQENPWQESSTSLSMISLKLVETK